MPYGLCLVCDCFWTWCNGAGGWGQFTGTHMGTWGACDTAKGCDQRTWAGRHNGEWLGTDCSTWHCVRLIVCAGSSLSTLQMRATTRQRTWALSMRRQWQQSMPSGLMARWVHEHSCACLHLAAHACWRVGRMCLVRCFMRTGSLWHGVAGSLPCQAAKLLDSQAAANTVRLCPGCAAESQAACAITQQHAPARNLPSAHTWLCTHTGAVRHGCSEGHVH